MNCLASRVVGIVALLGASSVTLLGQQDRITRPVDRLRTARLRGNVHPQARTQFDAGAVDPSLHLDHVMVMLKRSDAQQAALDRLLVEQQDRSSPSYHAWLSPEQFADRFGLSPNDVVKVASWLRSEGLTVDQISRSRNWIWFSGTAAQMETALRADLRRYRVDGEMHFANAAEPSLPEAIEPFVSGVLGLDDFEPKPSGSRRVPLSPQFTSAIGTHSLAPDDLATIYNISPLYLGGYDGSGQRVVVAGRSAINLSDIQTFRSTFGLPKNDPQILLVPGTTDPGHVSSEEEGEADLDIEWAGAVARNANIIYVYSPSVSGISVPYAIDQHLGSIITYSFGLCESLNSPSGLTAVRSYAQQANAQGITWVTSSGDSGAAGCDPHGDPTNPKAKFGLAVSIPASLPEVTAVGGTQFDEGSGVYWSTSNTPITRASALAYIPEKAWNESSAIGLLSTGGGLSVKYSKPLWQTGPGVPSANFRAIPDVSLTAAGHDGYRVISGGSTFIYSGTSASAPAFAGLLALVNQYQELNGVQTQSGQGNINPNLYRLAQNSSGIFHDVTNGDNIVPCVVGMPNCSTGTLGYSAGPGYDLATGLGSVDGYNLAIGLAAQWNTPAIASATPTSVIAGGLSFTLAVNGSGFDSGTVIQWKGTTLPTTFVTGTQLRATVSAALIAAAGSADITVLSAHGISAPITLTIVPSFGNTFSAQMVTATAPPCTTPLPATDFGIGDRVYLYFVGSLTNNNLLTREWVAPSGFVVSTGSWAVQLAGNFCFRDASFNLASLNFNPVGLWEVRVYDHGSLLFSIGFNVNVPGNKTTPLAHAADGSGFKTTVLLTNAGTAPAPYTLRFNDDQGNVPVSRFEIEAGSLSGIVPAGGSATIRTAGLGSATVSGWAELTAPATVGGSVIYSQKTGLPSIQEGTATIVAAASQHFFLPFDNADLAVTGVAITNPGASAANIGVTIRYSDGTSETSSFPLASRNHQAFAMSGQFPNTADKRGVAEFTSSTPLYAVVFRFNSTLAFTALDVASAGTSTAVNKRPLAHAADGAGFKTTVLLTNSGTAQASYALRFNDDTGNIPATRFELEAGSLTGTIPAGGSATIRTKGLGALVAGWAELTAPDSVGGSVIYSQKTGLPSIQEGTASAAAAVSKHFFLPFDNTAGAITGVAITNPGASQANVSVTFRYSDGTSEVVAYQLARRTHQAFRIFDQFANTANRKGVAEFNSAGTPLSTAVFRFNSTGAFTSLETVVP